MKPRLLFVVHRYPDGGGISSILETYAAALAERYEVHVAIVEQGSDSKRRLPLPDEQVHLLGYSNAINPSLFPTSVAYVVRVARFLERLVARLKPTVVITKDALNLPVPALVAGRRHRVPVVVMDHGTLTNVYEDAWLPMLTERLGGMRGRVFEAGFRADTPWRALRWRLGVRWADELWFTGEELRPWFGRAGSRAREYRQAVPTDFTPPSDVERRLARESLGLSDGEIVFNYVGRLDGEKGLADIVEVISRHRDSMLPWRLLVAGDGTMTQWLDDAIISRGLSDRVTTLGRLARPEVLRVQQASDFHLYAGTFSCGVSICLLEAMAAGVVPIVSDVPAAQVPLVGDAGWVFPAGDVDAFAGAFAAALGAETSERRARGRRAAERVHSVGGPSIEELVDEIARPSATVIP